MKSLGTCCIRSTAAGRRWLGELPWALRQLPPHQRVEMSHLSHSRFTTCLSPHLPPPQILPLTPHPPLLPPPPPVPPPPPLTRRGKGEERNLHQKCPTLRRCALWSNSLAHLSPPPLPRPPRLSLFCLSVRMTLLGSSALLYQENQPFLLYPHTLTPVPLETHRGPPISTRSPSDMDSRSTMQEMDVPAARHLERRRRRHL